MFMLRIASGSTRSTYTGAKKLTSTTVRKINKYDYSDGERATRLQHKWSERRTDFFHRVGWNCVPG
jgi:hypothetical protein